METLSALNYYRVKYGDTLATLGAKFYGDERLGLAIYQHNRHYIQNPNLLYPGQMICIPHIETTDMVII